MPYENVVVGPEAPRSDGAHEPGIDSSNLQHGGHARAGASHDGEDWYNGDWHSWTRRSSADAHWLGFHRHDLAPRSGGFGDRFDIGSAATTRMTKSSERSRRGLPEESKERHFRAGMPPAAPSYNGERDRAIIDAWEQDVRVWEMPVEPHLPGCESWLRLWTALAWCCSMRRPSQKTPRDFLCQRWRSEDHRKGPLPLWGTVNG